MLHELFVSKARVALLKVLLLQPEGRFYLRELAAKAGVSLRSAQLELARLCESGVVVREESGRQTYYSVNERCPIVPDLRSMFIKTVGVADVLKEALRPERKSIRRALIFGSFATGEVTPESDVDLLVVGDIRLQKVVSLLRAVQLGRAINPVVMSDSEFGERIASEDHFLNTVLSSPVIDLIGGEDESARAA